MLILKVGSGWAFESVQIYVFRQNHTWVLDDRLAQRHIPYTRRPRKRTLNDVSPGDFLAPLPKQARRVTLEQSHEPLQVLEHGTSQKMNVIRHDNIGIEFDLTSITLLEEGNDDLFGKTQVTEERHPFVRLHSDEIGLRDVGRINVEQTQTIVACT